MYTDIERLINQINEAHGYDEHEFQVGYDDINGFDDYDSDEPVDAIVYLNLKDAINRVAKDSRTKKEIFRYFVNACGKSAAAKRPWKIIDNTFLAVSHYFPWHSLWSAQKFEECPDEAYSFFAASLKKMAKNNNSNIRQYIEAIANLVDDFEVELECEPEEDLEDIAREGMADAKGVEEHERPSRYYNY